jgi:hypothetical protein
MVAKDFLEELVRVATPTENFWGWVLVVGASFLVLALAWMMVQTVRASTGWRRPVFWLLFLIPFFLTGTTAILIHAERKESGLAFLATLGSLVVLLLVVLLVSLRRWPLSRWPLRLLLAGMLLSATPFAYTRLVEPIVLAHFRPPYVAKVNGEVHVTLTGIPNYDYAKLARFQEAAVLQMANPDVTDATLKLLRDFTELKELDLNDTAITDAGLAELQNCPRLETLRLKNTRITDAGFRAHLLDRDSLREIDVRETEVKSRTLRDWKMKKDGRKFLK